MIQIIHKKLVAVAMIITFATGCRTTQEYQEFAKAGINFAGAINTLLEAASDIAIDTTSERVLSDIRFSRELRSNNEAIKKEAAKEFVSRYNKFSKKDKEWLELINEVRKHNHLLQYYFSTLLTLAESQSPSNSQIAINNTVTELKNSGSKLIELSPIKIEQLPSITRIVLDARIRGALKSELEKRKYTIYRQITIQEKLLTIISESMEKNVKILRDLKEYRLVIQPIIEQGDINTKKENEWVKTRNTIILLKDYQDKISKIKEASDKLRTFKQIFINSIEGEITSNRIQSFIQEANSFSTLVSQDK